MKTRALGDLSVSVVGLGCNNFGQRLEAARTERVVGAALDAGITLFDTADVYGGSDSERYLGRALRFRRDEAVVATKFGLPLDDSDIITGGAHPDYVRRCVEGSLRRLGTDRIDLYQLHSPDPDVPLEDTLGVLDEQVAAGKVLEVGCSNFDAAQIDAAESLSAAGSMARFVSVQNRYSLLTRDPENDGVLDACARHGIGMLPYFPLEGGLLTGKYRRGEPLPEGTRLASMGERASRFRTDASVEAVERLRTFCEQRGRSLLDLAVSWLAAQPAVASVIAGATRPEQVVANVEAAGWPLTSEELTEIDELVA